MNPWAISRVAHGMMTIEQFARDHRTLVAAAGRAADFADPVAVDFDEFSSYLIKNAKKGPPLAFAGAMIREWSTNCRRESPHVRLGMRPYQVSGLHFVLVKFQYCENITYPGHNFAVVDRRDYSRLYRMARVLKIRESESASAPILPASQFEQLRQNTIEFLRRENMNRIRELGGRLRRGVLLNGPPGNGKTSACRWLESECLNRGWGYSLITADAYAEARRGCNPEARVRALFEIDGRGVVVFDDFDMALRDRDSAPDSDHQSVFLNALDGVHSTQGVIYVFTTNCSLDRIDKAFRRPGRIDLVMTFAKPDDELRRKLIHRWHAEIRAGIDVAWAVESTEGFSFAEFDEVRNLMILAHLDSGEWNWEAAIEQFQTNRLEWADSRKVGFVAGL